MAMEAAPMPTTTSPPRTSIKQEAETPPIMAKHDTTSEGAIPTSVEATTRQTNNHSTPPRPPPPSRSDTGDITEKHFNMARTPRHCNKSREAAAQGYESTSKEGGINVVAPSSTSEGRSRTSSSSRDREQQRGEPSSTSSSSRRVVVHRSYYPPNNHHHHHAPPPPSHYEGYWESTHPSSPNPHHPYSEHPPGDPRYHPSPHHDPRYAHSYPHPPPPPPHNPYHDHHERRHRSSSSRGYYDYHHPSPHAYYDSPHHSSHHYYAPPTRGEHHSSREVREHSSHPSREHHTIVPPAQQQQQQRDRFYSNDSTSYEVQRVRGESLSLPSKDGSLHAVSSSFSHEGNKSLKNGSVAMKAPQLIAVKQSPGVVTHAGSVGSSIDKDSTANTGTNQSTIPNQPSLKSTSCEQDDDASDSSWRQLQQIASVDKDEMLRLQTSKSGELAANTPTLGMMSPNTTKGNNCKVKESSTLVVEKKLEVETVHKEEGGQEKQQQQQQQQQSPGDLKEVPSTLSRTSSLSNSPTDEHHNHHDHRPGPVAAEDEYHHHQSYQYPPHQYHTSPHHHHPARYPPPRLSMIPQGRAAENEEDPSPSASTISTKASLLRGPVGHGAVRRLEEDQQQQLQQQLEQQQPQAFFRDSSPPTMKPKHPVHVKKSREESNSRQQETDAEVVEAKRRKLSDTSVDAAVVKTEARNDDSSPVDSATSSEGLGGVAKDIASSSTHVALDGRVMAESPTDNPTNSANSTAGQSHHSNQSLELGAMPSWETAGKPLAGWSVCSGMTEIGMGSLKDGQGLLSGAFSFSEVYKSDNNGGSGKESGDDSPNNLENEEQDPSPKSILSKDGEKRKSLAPGTHVQFSRETGRHPSGLEVSTSTSSSGSRKRSRGASSSSAPQPPPPHYDEYYYDYPRHPPAHPYDYGRPGMPPPPPGHHPGSRGHPREHVYYLEDDPYHYYGHHPPPPPPYGYPRRHPRGPPSHLPPHHDYPPHHAPPPHHHARGRPTISTVHTPPGIHHPDPHHHHLPPPITSSARGSSGASTFSLSAGGAGWDKEDDMALMEIMKKKKNPKNWEGIASKLNRNKSSEACQERWTRYLKPGSRKGQWTDEEDHIVVDAVTNSVEDPFTRWSDLASQLPGRVGKQVRDRWVNHLNPAINHLPFSRDDDLRLWEGHHVLGKRWVEISTKFFKGTRSENHIKNRWYSASFKKFIAKEFGPDAYSIGNENPGCGGRIDGGAPPPVMSPVHHVRHYGNSAPIISGDHLNRDL